MTNLVKRFLVEQEGQDLIEYTLLLAFVCLTAAAVFIQVGQNASTVWSVASTQMSGAASAAVS